MLNEMGLNVLSSPNHAVIFRGSSAFLLYMGLLTSRNYCSVWVVLDVSLLTVPICNGCLSLVAPSVTSSTQASVNVCGVSLVWEGI